MIWAPYSFHSPYHHLLKLLKLHVLGLQFNGDLGLFGKPTHFRVTHLSGTHGTYLKFVPQNTSAFIWQIAP